MGRKKNVSSHKKPHSKVSKRVVGKARSTPHTLEDMLAAGKYDWVDENIIQENFPVDPARFTTKGWKIFHIEKTMTTPEIEAEIRRLRHQPATIEQLLAFGAEDPEEQRAYPIVGLGSPWEHPHDCYRVPVLTECNGDREVTLGFGSRWDEWHEPFQFLVFPLV